MIFKGNDAINDDIYPTVEVVLSSGQVESRKIDFIECDRLGILPNVITPVLREDEDIIRRIDGSIHIINI
tara:strand:+ start:358 stop:567 length:210 start_codon:yes stop_codon:yes gene_type:complete